MDNERTCYVLQKLIDAFPTPLSGDDFEVPKGEEQNFRNFLLELKERGFIKAGFIIGRGLEDYGLPRAVGDIVITNKGRGFML